MTPSSSAASPIVRCSLISMVPWWTLTYNVAQLGTSKPCKGVQILRKEQFAGLLGSSKGRVGGLPLGLVFQHYELTDGWIRPVGDTAWLDEDRAEDENLFLSFAGLGARGKPSEETILRWVRRYGLLWRENTRPEDDATNIEDFRREVLCIRQILVLYEAIQSQDPSVLKRLPTAGGPGGWQYTLPTEIDEQKHRYNLGDEGRSLPEAWRLLKLVLQEKMKDVRPTIADPFELTDGLKFRQGWYCRDVLSAIYLSFYLFATEGSPVRFCVACGRPIKSGRKDKLHCNETCRSNARHRRNREEKAR